MGSVPPLVSCVITLTQRVPPSTVVERPPTERSDGVVLEPKFQVPFLALEARLTPPSYMTEVAPLL